MKWQNTQGHFAYYAKICNAKIWDTEKISMSIILKNCQMQNDQLFINFDINAKPIF